jgi:hypothetical protein
MNIAKKGSAVGILSLEVGHVVFNASKTTVHKKN